MIRVSAGTCSRASIIEQYSQEDILQASHKLKGQYLSRGKRHPLKFTVHTFLSFLSLHFINTF